ncbi:uncharacterized protein PgNI_01556 [Pyricularia grisea]|uniref:Uncharacterized protein n=1 Tax=Pyricularia grisea TaxID=148305 RepID=A0A6P8BK70_PYRGI|nr:uncharacterized protein PgNI_01556 [Pyricularia grisea]TLD17084.1 hypothetical protein PgNI_01556 [Pyricularia grisea]
MTQDDLDMERTNSHRQLLCKPSSVGPFGCLASSRTSNASLHLACLASIFGHACFAIGNPGSPTLCSCRH